MDLWSGLIQTLKRMLHQVVDMEGRKWDLLLPYILFDETPQVSNEFTTFELLLAYKAWEGQHSPFDP